MIIEITGLPGNGKTLYALSFVKDWSERDNRPVYYSGINDLKLPWTEIDATKWFECPPNSIIVIDECQRIFRPRANGAAVPDYVSKLETHRHQGLDIVLITQHPLLTDSAVRRLVGQHKHVIRAFGMQAATIHEWGSIRENCDKPAGRRDSIKHHWKYDKAAYDFYKSAEVHTVKRNIPMRFWFLLLAPFLIAAAVWYVWQFAHSRAHPEKENSKAPASAPGGMPASSSSGSPAGNGKAGYMNVVEDAKQFNFEHKARIEGLPHTAPRYDEVTKATTAPLPVACVSNANSCRCYSQQGTIISTPVQLCADIVAKGFFVDFDDKGGHGEQRKESAALVQRADSVPLKLASADPVRSASVESSRVTVMPYDGPKRPGESAGSSNAPAPVAQGAKPNFTAVPGAL